MTTKIMKSQIGDEATFRATLDEYIQAKIASLDAVGEAAPHDDYLEQFIKRTPQGDPNPDKFEIDYELVDDTPTAEELRAKVLSELRAKEAAELEALVPSHKRRLFEMDHARASQRIGQAKIKGETPDATDQAIVDDYAAIVRRINEIQYAYAKREAEL